MTGEERTPESFEESPGNPSRVLISSCLRANSETGKRSGGRGGDGGAPEILF